MAKKELKPEEVSPHTIKKFELIEGYVTDWAHKILQFENSKGLVFIDCMCNQGIYVDKETKELIEGSALRVARVLNGLARQHYPKRIDVYFNDLDGQKVEVLKREISSKGYDKNIHVHYSASDSSVFLRTLHDVGSDSTQVLLFYDPFDAFVDWDVLQPFFCKWGEVIINHVVSDPIRAIRSATKPETIAKYEKTYGRTIEELCQANLDKNGYQAIIEELIAESTRKWQFYIAAFPFYIRTNVLEYNLTFFTGHLKGFQLFKQRAWQVFGGQSSTKHDAANIAGQMRMELVDVMAEGEVVEKSNYTVYDIACFVFNKYAGRVNVPFDEVYDVLAHHPIFPDSGFRREIKSALKEHFQVQIAKNTFTFPSKGSI